MSKLLLIIPLIFIQACTADTDLKNHSEKTYKLASNNFLEAKKEYEEKIIQCDKNKTIIPANKLKSVKLTKNELELALVVLSNRANNLCAEIEAGKFSIATSIYRTTAKHYDITPTLASNYTEDLVYGHYWGNLELEIKYLEINQQQRNELEKIEALKTPFFPFKTILNL